MNSTRSVKKRIEIIKEVLIEQEKINERNRIIKALKNARKPNTFKRKFYPTVKRHNRAIELIQKGIFTHHEIADILQEEFPEYKKRSHYNLIHKGGNEYNKTFEKLVSFDPITKIVTFDS